ncbi:hypothetical protein AAT19DRAFT_15703 [Rhodotorula toruloides]|uniref:Uncharacterized protein n=1 Tax=Rhodotorula toruloides TaxID=5286 RepID=A0A2T0A4P6_RHOTO|nr:hypothetical protein AAT19DRAFT_15703 [Rhodotorula toruloides]
MRSIKSGRSCNGIGDAANTSTHFRLDAAPLTPVQLSAHPASFACSPAADSPAADCRLSCWHWRATHHLSPPPRRLATRISVARDAVHTFVSAYANRRTLSPSPRCSTAVEGELAVTWGTFFRRTLDLRRFRRPAGLHRLAFPRLLPPPFSADDDSMR